MKKSEGKAMTINTNDSDYDGDLAVLDGAVVAIIKANERMIDAMSALEPLDDLEESEGRDDLLAAMGLETDQARMLLAELEEWRADQNPSPDG